MHRLPPVFYAIVLLVTGLLPWGSPGAAEVRPTELSGEVISFSGQTALLSVNTRLGPRQFRLTPTTLVFLNNHTADRNAITAGDTVTVQYRFDTLEAFVVQLFRTIRNRGVIRGVSATVIEQTAARGALLQLRPDSQSRVELEDIPLSDRRVLIGRGAIAVFEPGTFLLLSLTGGAPVFSGRISAVDAANRLVSIQGRGLQVFTVDQFATVRRSGQVVTLANLVIGDRVRAAFVREGSTRRLLALDARP